MLVSKKLADLKIGDLVATQQPAALETWVSHGIEAVRFERVGTVQGYALNHAGEVAVMVQWLNSPLDLTESWAPSMLMRLSA
jgi:hypothetical protein